VKGKALPPHSVLKFQETIYRHYRENPRDLPWRKTKNPYRILISEVMLQQTQVERVIVKYKEFIRAFPNFASLAKAPLQEILRAWQGMGYNRRAVSLKRIARFVTGEFRSKLPSSEDELMKLPGIGKYSASAILAFVFNRPTVFIETNIRRVFIHFFFHDKENIHDREVLPLIEMTLDRSDPREWYYALMDYGVMLKKERENPNRKSAHYRRQAPFKGSNRQVRGMILALLVKRPDISETDIARELKLDPERIKENLAALQREGFMKRKGEKFAMG
jgi:A/G-specific adenine glycosylase